MGWAKERMMREQSQGWLFKDGKYVCSDCFVDETIKSFIKSCAEAKICSYCKESSRKPIAAPMNDVLELIVEGLRSEWMDPNDILGWDSGEGGWQGEVYDTYDFFAGGMIDAIESPAILEEVLDALGSDTQWCSRDYSYTQEGKRLYWGWERFCEHVKHKTRYMFFDSIPDSRADESVHPTLMLDSIGSVIRELGLVKRLPPGTVFFRARAHDRGKEFHTVDDLGPPPVEKTIPNRMSPQGIPMFYASSEMETATAEIREEATQAISLGSFETLRELLIVDLSDVPPIPSLFDRARRAIRQQLLFLNNFVDDISKPIQNDARIHTEYVPTQIVTEYFRFRFLQGTDPIHGISFPSSRGSGINLVLFCDAAHVLDSSVPEWRRGEAWLRLTSSESVVLKEGD